VLKRGELQLRGESVRSKDIEIGKRYDRPALRSLTFPQAKKLCQTHFDQFLMLIFPSRRAQPIPAGLGTIKKEYQRPSLRRLTPEQAKLLLIGHATIGDQGAKDLMDVVFPDPAS
jgi:hypothetical protein